MQALTLTFILSTIPLALGYLFDAASNDAPAADRFVAGFYLWIIGGWLVLLYALPGMAELAEQGHFDFPTP